MTGGMSALANDKTDALAAAEELVAPLEKDGYEFRAEAWTGSIKPEMGRAVRVQLFKGLDYRFCIAIPADSKSKITATLLDFEGKATGEASVTASGKGVIVSAKPKKTGVYALAIRQTEGKRDATCVVITGWK